MNFRLFDIVETEKFQFVRIHKNGNQSVAKCIYDNLRAKIFYKIKNYFFVCIFF